MFTSPCCKELKEWRIFCVCVVKWCRIPLRWFCRCCLRRSRRGAVSTADCVGSWSSVRSWRNHCLPGAQPVAGCWGSISSSFSPVDLRLRRTKRFSVDRCAT